MKARASCETLGLMLLRALRHEKDSGKTLLDCRAISAIAKELRFSQSDFDAAIGFLVENRAINAADRPDGKAVLPSARGEEILSTEKNKNAWTLDRRIALYGVIGTIISAGVAVIVWLSSR